MAVLEIAQLLQPKPIPQVPPSYNLNLREVEMHAPSCSGCQRAVALEDPRYGLRDVEVHEPRVWVVLRSNGYEDGDYVTLKVNGRVYVSNMMLRNAGNSVVVDVNPGPNLVEIYSEHDGGGGVTLAADVSGVGNMTNMPFPEKSTASFYIILR